MFSASSVGFTAKQRDAITWRQMDACVVAGPGSGKTTVLVERCRSLIVDHGFDPAHLLAITFTEKAAANMKAKLAEQFEHDPARRRELDQAWVSTIHGFCARLLRENSIAAGIDPRFTVLDAREADALQYECLNAALDDLTADPREETLALIAALGSPNSLAGDLRTAYDAIRAAGLSLAEVRALPNPAPELDAVALTHLLRQIVAAWSAAVVGPLPKLVPQVAEWTERLAETPAGNLDALRALGKFPDLRGKIPEPPKSQLAAFKHELLPALIARTLDQHIAVHRALVFDALDRFELLYRRRKSELAGLDFNDLERLAIEMLERDTAVAARIRGQFRQVLVDEFQDINEQQQKLIQLVRGENVFFAVGDRNQSIYGFRHARPEIFQRYREEIASAGKHAVDLDDNFRSRPEILACVEAVVADVEGVEQRTLTAAAEFSAKDGASIEILKVIPDEDDAGSEEDEKDDSREALWIAERILALRGSLDAGKGRKADFGDFAVLFRANESMKPLLEVFDRVRVPYVCGRRQSFLVSREGLDITALLATIANPRDGIALATVLRSELVEVSDEALLRTRLLAGSLTSGLNTLAFDGFAPDDAAKLGRFMQNLRRWRAEQPVVSLDLLLARALDDCGFGWTPGTQRGDNVESFLALARARSGRMTLERFLIEVEGIASAVNTESDLSDRDQGNRVQVMTMHAAKGLEFPVTILASLEKSARFNSSNVSFTPVYGLGIKWQGGASDSWHAANKSVIEQREKEEASRLLYVAMTRAEQHLILSYTKKKSSSSWVKRIEERAPAEIRILNSDPAVYEIEAPQLFQHSAETIPPPAIEEQHDSAVNVTSLAAFADCPRRYYIERYLGWGSVGTPGRKRAFDAEELPRDTDTPAAELGSQVHEILAGKTDARHSDDARLLAQIFRDSAVGRQAASSSRQAREWEFIADISGTLVRGSIDLWFEENGQLHLVDYKTDDISAADCAARAARYRPQLALYALALERALGRRPSSASLHFLRPDVVAEVAIDDRTIADAVELVGRLGRAQDRLEFDLNEGEHCRKCPNYRSLCPASLDSNQLDSNAEHWQSPTPN